MKSGFNLWQTGDIRLTVVGNELAPEIGAGDIVVFSPDERPADGDICLILVKEQEIPLIRRVIFNPLCLHLIAPRTPGIAQVVPMTSVERVIKAIWVVKSLNDYQPKSERQPDWYGRKLQYTFAD